MKNTSIVKEQFHYTDLEFREVWAGVIETMGIIFG